MLLGWAVLASAGPPAGLAAGAVRYARLIHACPPPRPGRASCFAVERRPVAAASASAAGVHPYTVGAGARTYGLAGGLTPADLASAYGYEPTVGGAGQTIGIVDAYDDPEIGKDLKTFDEHYGLEECTKPYGCFRKVDEKGKESPLPAEDIGWSQEISLDVETARAACRQCNILLVEANSPEYTDLAKAVDEAVALGATEVSNSYGGPEEEILQEAGVKEAYEHPGVVITAAAGDDGYDDWDSWDNRLVPPAMPDAPASLPSVVAVGGTSLKLNEDGTRASETVWNDDGFKDTNHFPPGYVGGGGCSTLFEAQPFQLDAAGFSASGCEGKRLSVDVSADADPYTGFDIYDTFDYCTATKNACDAEEEELEEANAWQTFGGTSLGTPLIAALYALAGGDAALKYPALTLYGHLGQASSLYDVTEGGNGYCDGEPVSLCGHPNKGGIVLDCEGTSACDARTGYDGPTGVGTPNGLEAFKPLTEAEVKAKEAQEAKERQEAKEAKERQEAKEAKERQEAKEAKERQEALAAAASLAAAGSKAVAGFQGVLIPPVPDASLASTGLQESSKGTVTLKIGCPSGESACVGTVGLRTLSAVVADLAGAAKSKARILTLATGSFDVPGGQVRTVTLHLSAKARALLARLHSVRVRVTLLAHDAAGATHNTVTIGTLRAPKAKHGKG